MGRTAQAFHWFESSSLPGIVIAGGDTKPGQRADRVRTWESGIRSQGRRLPRRG